MTVFIITSRLSNIYVAPFQTEGKSRCLEWYDLCLVSALNTINDVVFCLITVKGQQFCYNKVKCGTVVLHIAMVKVN